MLLAILIYNYFNLKTQGIAKRVTPQAVCVDISRRRRCGGPPQPAATPQSASHYDVLGHHALPGFLFR